MPSSDHSQDSQESGVPPPPEQLSLPRQVELALIAEDAVWAVDSVRALSVLSGRDPSLAAFCIYPHLARIVHEAVRYLARVYPELAAHLTLEYRVQIEAARHSVKLFDDNQRGFDGVTEWFESENANAQRDAFIGNARWRWLRRFETDMGQYYLDDSLVMTNHVATYHIALPLAALADKGLQRDFSSGASFNLGQVLGTLADGLGGQDRSSTLSISSLGNLRTRDVRTEHYLRRRFDPAFSGGVKLALTAMQCSLNSITKVLALTELGHEAAMFRVRLVTLSHVLSALDEVRTRFGHVVNRESTAHLDALLGGPVAQMVRARPCRALRNVSVHYGVDPSWSGLDPRLPMCGLVEALVPQCWFEQLRSDLRELTVRAATTLNAWGGGI
jgi:hypothetical protein